MFQLFHGLCGEPRIVPQTVRPVQHDAGRGAQHAQLHLWGLRAFAPPLNFVPALLDLSRRLEPNGRKHVLPRILLGSCVALVRPCGADSMTEI
eukprot:COSAG01_NODE_20080_length_972_cov_0.975945_1_plen_92_part_10